MINKLIRYLRKESTARMRKRLRNELKSDFDLMVSRIKFVQGERHGWANIVYIYGSIYTFSLYI